MKNDLLPISALLAVSSLAANAAVVVPTTENFDTITDITTPGFNHFQNNLDVSFVGSGAGRHVNLLNDDGGNNNFLGLGRLQDGGGNDIKNFVSMSFDIKATSTAAANYNFTVRFSGNYEPVGGGATKTFQEIARATFNADPSDNMGSIALHNGNLKGANGWDQSTFHTIRLDVDIPNNRFSTYFDGMLSGDGVRPLAKTDIGTFNYYNDVRFDLNNSNGGEVQIDNFSITSVPEPSGAMLLILGSVGMVMSCRRR